MRLAALRPTHHEPNADREHQGQEQLACPGQHRQGFRTAWDFSVTTTADRIACIGGTNIAVITVQSSRSLTYSSAALLLSVAEVAITAGHAVQNDVF